MKNLSPATWSVVSKLLDEALDLPPDARTEWLDRVGREQPELAPTLRQLLAAHADSETDELLQHLPAPPVHAAHPGGLAAGDRVGPYRLLRELGRGGMADVWLAERADGAFKREVALKLPLVTRLRRDLATRFERERDILARLEHPHIARLYDAGVTADGAPYLAMEYVDGLPIIEYCDRQRLDVGARLRLFMQVLDAVQFAHANLIIHRDLKPSNILVGNDATVRLLDFGIAKLLADDESSRETLLTQFAGRALTPDYASPEQIKGEPLTIASDVYSLGVVLYELLAGQRPYRLRMKSLGELEQAIVAVDAPKPSSVVVAEAAPLRGTSAAKLARALAGDLDTIMLKALAKASAQRYPTVAEYAEDLRRHVAGLPVQARPASLGYRAHRFVARNRLAVAAFGGFALTLLVATAVSLWQARVAREHAQVAAREARRAEEVKTFLLSVFEDADPGAGGGRQLSAVDLLRQARERLVATPVADPATRVELQTAIGSSLRAIGDYQQSTAVLKDTVRLALTQLGEHHPRTVAAQALLGNGAIVLGERGVAEANLDAAERGMRHLRDMKWLSFVLRGQSQLRSDEGRYEIAIELAKEAVEVAKTYSVGGDKRPLIDSYLALVNRMHGANRKGRLEPALRAYELAREVYGDHPAGMLDARRVYASALVDEGDIAVGLSELREIARQRTQLLGEIHKDVEVTYREIGWALLKLGDLAGAIEAYGKAQQIVRALAGGKPTAGAANTALNLGAILASARRHGEALSQFREADAIYASISAPEHGGARRARASIGGVLTDLERLDEADAIFAGLLQRPHTDAMDEAVINWRLGALRCAQGKQAQGQALLRKSIEFFTRGAMQRQLAGALRNLGAALLADGQVPEAVAALERARAIFEESQRKGSPDLADISVNIARANLALGRNAEAVAAAQWAAGYWDSFDPVNRNAGVAHLWHARALMATRQMSEAEQAFRRASEILGTTALPSDRNPLAQTRRELHAGKTALLGDRPLLPRK